MVLEKKKTKKTPPIIVPNSSDNEDSDGDVYPLRSRVKRKPPPGKKVKEEEGKGSEPSTSTKGRKQVPKTSPKQSPIVRSPSPPIKKTYKSDFKGSKC